MCKRKEPTTEAAVRACCLTLWKVALGCVCRGDGRMNPQGSIGITSFTFSVILQPNEEHLLFQYCLCRTKVSIFYLIVRTPLSARGAFGLTFCLPVRSKCIYTFATLSIRHQTGQSHHLELFQSKGPSLPPLLLSQLSKPCARMEPLRVKSTVLCSLVGWWLSGLVWHG